MTTLPRRGDAKVFTGYGRPLLSSCVPVVCLAVTRLAILRSRAQLGVEAPPVTIEVFLSSGLPVFSIVESIETPDDLTVIVKTADGIQTREVLPVQFVPLTRSDSNPEDE